MASNSVSHHEHVTSNSHSKWDNESCAQGEVGAIVIHSSPLLNRQVPRVEPEEDTEVPKPEALLENQAFSRTLITDATNLENQESTMINLCSPRKEQGIVTELEQLVQLSGALKPQEELDLINDPCDNTALLSPPISALPTEECLKTKGLSSLEGEVAEWISEGEIISDATESLTPDFQNIQEYLRTPPLIWLFYREVDRTPEEVTAHNVRKVENPSQLNFSDCINSETLKNMPAAATAEVNSGQHCPSEENNTHNVHTVECDGEEEVSTEIMSCQQQCSTQNMRSRLSHSPRTTTPALPSAEQQSELFSQISCETVPRGVNQEAYQQVHGQGMTHLSMVVIELSNLGGVVSEGSGYFIAPRERHSRVGERAEVESRQTGGEERQKEGGLKREEAVEQQDTGRLFSLEIKTEKTKFVSSKDIRMESDSCDDSLSDSSVSADLSSCSTLEGNTTISVGAPAAPIKETPIEREIRRAIEREYSLRRSRGLPNPPTAPEYIEISLRKTGLCQSITANTERCQGKDRQYAGKKMHHEIHEEVQREDALVKLGKVPGFYDKGTVREVKERKQLFETFQKSSDSTRPVTTKRKVISSATDNTVELLLQASMIGSSNSMNKQGSTSPQEQGLSDGRGCQVINQSHNPEAEPVTEICFGNTSSGAGGHCGIKMREREKKETELSTRESPFLKMRSSTIVFSVEQDIREAQERERELLKQRISLYGSNEGAKGGGVRGGELGTPTENKNPTLSSSLNGRAGSGPSFKGVTGPTAARHSVGKLGVWPPAQAKEEKMKEVLSPWTPRQKTPLVQRWESGLVNGHIEDDD